MSTSYSKKVDVSKNIFTVAKTNMHLYMYLVKTWSCNRYSIHINGGWDELG